MLSMPKTNLSGKDICHPAIDTANRANYMESIIIRGPTEL